MQKSNHIHYLNRTKNKTYVVILEDIGKTFDKLCAETNHSAD